uniref:Core shell protein Gag P30 domain-containing protein n=1 Tax=Malurus cyaneus samueli TaxID=2593467 RepID=A0A8C5TS32_9PASS
MGNGQSKKGILKKSPLGCILQHWKKIGGPPGGRATRENLIKFCNQWWPLYKLDSGEKWPKNGTLNYRTLLKLMLFLRQEQKWDEVMYADMFFTLRNHPEWQTDCGLNPAPSDPFVLALEKQNQAKWFKNCCSLCSMGQTCPKHPPSMEDDLDVMVSPNCRLHGGTENQAAETDNMREHQEVDLAHLEEKRDRTGRMYQGAEGFSPAAERAKHRDVRAAASCQAVSMDGPITTEVPFSVTDLNNWKLMAGTFQDDPDKMAKAFEMMIKIQDPDWKDIDTMLEMLFDSTEREMVVKTSRRFVEEQILTGNLSGTLDINFPTVDPKWDPNVPIFRERLNRYQQWILYGIQNAIPKAINMSKLFEIKQDHKETPTEFLSHLKERAQKYTNTDPETEKGKTQSAPIFLGQFSDDIRRKPQQVQGQDQYDLGKLLNVAGGVYQNRENQQEITKQKVAGVNEGISRGMVSPGKDRAQGCGQPTSNPPRRLGINQCACCKKDGHWKRDCQQLQHQSFPPVAVTNDD